MAALAILKNQLPWIQSPLIINAPMSGVATSELATAVTRAGGLGQIGYMDDIRALSKELDRTRKELQDIMATLPDPDQLPRSVWESLYSDRQWRHGCIYSRSTSPPLHGFPLLEQAK